MILRKKTFSQEYDLEDYINDIEERAFCEGYECAQKEFSNKETKLRNRKVLMDKYTKYQYNPELAETVANDAEFRANNIHNAFIKSKEWDKTAGRAFENGDYKKAERALWDSKEFRKNAMANMKDHNLPEDWQKMIRSARNDRNTLFTKADELKVNHAKNLKKLAAKKAEEETKNSAKVKALGNLIAKRLK